MTLRLSLLAETFAVCRLEADDAHPDWIPWRAELVSVSHSAEELSVVCPAAAVPAAVTAAVTGSNSCWDWMVTEATASENLFKELFFSTSGGTVTVGELSQGLEKL